MALVDDTNRLDEKHNSSSETEKIAQPYRKATIVAATLIVGIAMPITFALYYIFASRSGYSQFTGPCGNSSVEALALGCSFDQLMWAWYPKHCPHYANEEYLQAEADEPWRFYIDPYKKRIASGEEWIDALDNKVPVYGERREHLTHCVYMYLSLGQIIRDGTRYTPRQVEYEHLEHCSVLLLEALRNDTNWYQIQTKAPHVFYDQDC
ncbi:hypothetical protein OEA41_005549 [Lepraria neglecta]|uniref:Uncharacterized protein n=1 Tax=Lepraria neglecta TaxID=209136 RepID=A0AAD9ZJQ2_9LECA|nr:hypothetical protein OEA41_005549 [Lepraria neglecta]